MDRLQRSAKFKW